MLQVGAQAQIGMGDVTSSQLGAIMSVTSDVSELEACLRDVFDRSASALYTLCLAPCLAIEACLRDVFPQAGHYSMPPTAP